MDESCENCPSVFLSGARERKASIRHTRELNEAALARVGILGILTGKDDGIKTRIAINESQRRFWDEILPDTVIDASKTCVGPFSRIAKTTDSEEQTMLFKELVCGAEVAASLNVSATKQDEID